MKKYICCMIKDEHKFLDEWITYHLNIVDQIYFYEDYESQPHNEITDKYGDRVILHRLKKDLTPRLILQAKCYTEFKQKYMKDDECCFFIDSDEFIVFSEGKDVDWLIEECNKNNMIEFPVFWKMYNANGHIESPEGNVMDNYTEATDATLYNIAHDSKTFFIRKKGRFNLPFFGAHHCKLWKIYVLDELKAKYFDDIHLNHYYTKSWEDWKCKKMKNSLGEMSIQGKAPFLKFNPDLKDKI